MLTTSYSRYSGKRLCTLFLAALLATATLAQAQRMPVTTASDAARVQYIRGLEALVNVDNARALVHFDAALAADPDFALAHLYRAATTAEGRDAHMRRATALAANASAGERQSIEAYAASLGGDPDRQVALLTEVAAAYPGDPIPMYIVGNTEAVRGDPAASIAAARRALVADPSFAPAYNLIGYAEVERGDLAAAEAAFRDYVRLAPDQANAYDSFGEFYLGQGRLDEAEAQYRHALRVDAGFANARTMLARVGIERSDLRFEQAVAAGDADAIAALYTESAIILPPGSPPIQGRAAIREYMAGLVAAGVDGVDIETVEVVRFDDVAIERADITVRVGGQVVEHGKSLVVWRLVGDEWLYVRDMWSSNAPATTASN